VQAGGPALGTTEPRIPQVAIASYQGIVPKTTDWRELGSGSASAEAKKAS
jgi:phthalate 4,5-dioxygenase oxygenase subunit